MTANDSSSDSGASLESDTHPEACWTVYEWIVQTDSLVGTSLKTRYDKSVQWKNPVKLDVLELAGCRCREHAFDYGAEGKTGCHSCHDLQYSWTDMDLNRESSACDAKLTYGKMTRAA